MSIEAVGIGHVSNRQVAKTNLKSSQSFTSNPEVDEEKSNATKYMIGATALAAVIGLGVLGYKGKLGKGIQEFLGGAEKAAEKGTKGAKETGESAGSASKSLSEGAEKSGEKVGNSTTNVEPKAPEKAAEKGTKGAQETGESAGSASKSLSEGAEKSGEKVGNSTPNAEPKAPEKAAEVPNADTKAPDLSQGLKPISTKHSDGRYACKIAPNGTKTVINRVPLTEGRTHVSTSITKDGYSYLKFVTYDKNKKVLETDECITMPTFVTFAHPGNHGYAEAKKEVFAKLREGLKWEEK